MRMLRNLGVIGRMDPELQRTLQEMTPMDDRTYLHLLDH